MARPTKEGLDYFELDCRLNDDIKLIQAEFGLKGFAVVVKLWQKIYSERGYYCEWNDDVLLLFMAENALSGDGKNLIQAIINSCLKRDIFSEELFHRYHILTSAGIQKRYLRAVNKRGKVELKNEYLLVHYAHIPQNVVINSVSDVKNSVSDVNNPQRREEKKREEKSKERGCNFDPESRRLAELYNSLCPSLPAVKNMSSARAAAVKEVFKNYNLDGLKVLFTKAQASSFLTGGNPRGWTATFDWLINPVNAEKVIEGNYDNRGGKNCGNAFHNCEQRNTDYDDMMIDINRY